jgi:peroxin-7
VHVLELNAAGQLAELKSFTSPEGLYDCSWNELNQNQLATASVDGSVCVWDLGAVDGLPVARWPHAHASEASAVDWNFIVKDRFLTAGWDGTVKLWQPDRPNAPPVATFAAAAALGAPPAAVYNAIWSPHHPDGLASVAADGLARTWDARSGGLSGSVAAHADEALAVDFDKYVAVGCR